MSAADRRTSQMWTARTDFTGSQHFAQLTLQPVMQPWDEAESGPTLFTHWATWVWLCQQDMSAVAPRGHRMCTHLDIQGLRDNPPLCVADYCLVPCTPPLHATHVQARSFVVVEIVCISIYYKNLCERPLLPHYIKHHTCVLLIPNGCAIRKCVSCVLSAHTKQHLQLRSVCCP